MVAPTAAATNDPWAIDFRYAPPSWQTAICLPDDWQKTLVGKDGSLLYDYPGNYAGFGTRITFGLPGETQWLKQELASPRVPIVRTVQRNGDVEIVAETFALAPPLAAPRREAELFLERIDSQVAQTGWAAPPAGSDPAFCNAAIGFGHPIQYRFKAGKAARYTVVFGLCEGYHAQPGQRILTLQVEGKSLRTVDLVAEKGRNQPEVFSFPARDENGDGWIDLAVAAAENSPDQNTILNTLWVFPGSDLPPKEQLLAGQSARLPLAHIDCGADLALDKTPRHDLTLIRLRNTGTSAAHVAPALTIESASPIALDAFRQRVQIGGWTGLACSRSIVAMEKGGGRAVLHFPKTLIPAHAEEAISFVVARGRNAADVPVDLAQAESLRGKAERFWQTAPLPYDRIEIPDAGVQALLDSSIRNIYQAREIKKGLPAFQVGPTCYRGLWVVDGSFLLEAMTYLGRANETRNGVKYLMSFQREDGSFMLIDGHWKETGIALWAITRHARLTGDKEWLRETWPSVERGFAFIRKMRGMPAAEAPNARLIPDGFSDGGLADKVPEYTNIYWTMAGLRAAIEAARWLGQAEEAEDWQKECDDFLRTFRRAAERDTRTDAHGNHYVPIRMHFDEHTPPQKAQWAFLHSLFPGKVFAANDPLVQGNLAMLKAVEKQGLVQDTGWLKDGIWTYFGSFYGHAWLWLGEGDKAARTLYAFGNHASPLLAWREEQMPVGQGDQVVGDMPHNWASAEFIRLVRHSLILERGNELHLFEAMPAKWARPGAVTRVRDIATEFGQISFEFRVARDGASGILKLTPPQRTPPTRIVLHLDHWSGQTGTVDLPVRGPSKKTVNLPRGLEQ
ncbi:MAG: hypothetical protein ABSD29_14490 [Verrucomicrobiota bacterium]